MKEHKICVYAICKNEIKFVDRWLSSLYEESDYIVVLDTGSTDGTFEFLQNDLRVFRCEQKVFDPWRFDVARNYSMRLIPEDTTICVVSDLDQTFRKGWSIPLKQAFDEGYNSVAGPIIDYDDDNNELKRFFSFNVHSNEVIWGWERPVHEGLHTQPHGKENVKHTQDFVIEHHPDYTKTRGGYLEILRNEYKENSLDPMCAIYYGCELSIRGYHEESFEVFKEAVKKCDLKNFENSMVSCQLYLNLMECYIERRNLSKALTLGMEALDFKVNTRRFYYTLSKCSLDNNFKIFWLERALTVKNNVADWTEDVWLFEGCIEDELSLLYYYNGDIQKAKHYGVLAFELYHQKGDTENYERVKNNLAYYEERS